jgi:hypothetical protein
LFEEHSLAFLAAPPQYAWQLPPRAAQLGSSVGAADDVDETVDESVDETTDDEVMTSVLEESSDVMEDSTAEVVVVGAHRPVGSDGRSQTERAAVKNAP